MTSADLGQGLDRRARWLLPIALLVLAGLTAHRLLQPPAARLHRFGGETMGTTWVVKVAAARLDRESVSAAIEARLERVNRLMSTWNPKSELSRFNRHESREPFAIAPETHTVLAVARDVGERSGGAFDITVGPLVNAWGFGAERAAGPPSEETLARLRARVGYRRIVLGESTATKTHPATVCDLSAVAKGFAVDELARALLELEHENFLVEIGGELLARGRRADGRSWRVAVERPEPGTRAAQLVLELENLAMATSGDYRNFTEHEGTRKSHIIDPRTARPVAHRLASVTVVHERCDYADAFATALMVLGPDAGYTLAEREQLAACFIAREDGRFVVRATPAFEALRGAPE